jgi:hypothetical protein
MSSADRKRKILDHLNQSVEKSEFLTPKSANPPGLESPRPEPEAIKPLPEPPPAPLVETAASRQAERKRRVITHVNQSSGNFGDFSLSSPAEQQKKRDHIRKSLA